jgi:uncharacterized membrane protein
MTRRDERGQMTVMILGFTVIVLILLAVLVDVSKAFLVHRDLAQLADGAALAGTRGVSDSVRDGSVDQGVELSQEAAQHEVAKYLDSVQHGYDELDWSVSVDGAEVTVHLEATVDLPLRVPGAERQTAVEADGASELTSR